MGLAKNQPKRVYVNLLNGLGSQQHLECLRVPKHKVDSESSIFMLRATPLCQATHRKVKIEETTGGRRWPSADTNQGAILKLSIRIFVKINGKTKISNITTKASEYTLNSHAAS
ncbi:hypothetical protein Pmar_PMAR011103 [Perkinsus marinus ATCC 50983]|uniref:Uncharacterized protein n=1 Tax=Perkinsus marinus (strain ATCC 50983 / TXsc) TaxID=423536 RepID=C5KVQ2_PERM5|nr:hypothetical protein Pmar_PMAR011103 [Perkinsus marinus ATCC 50983]EER11437.1 hypothetical protein Pmar_PMAR011103 [Perkinsus marinus ATCC 50983]|eukprot:XP_002779642.1 hypothetical protein Pmar_PMAR011103 [Perkinsus marinus ATCC 50983]